MAVVVEAETAVPVETAAAAETAVARAVGGGGGGGAGGTVKLMGTVIIAPRAYVDVGGGSGGDHADPQQDGGEDGRAGRVIFSSNAGLSFDSQGRITSIADTPLAAYRTGSLPEYFRGPADANPYLADGDWDENTPTIAGLDGGADPFGLISGIGIGGLDFVPLDDDPGGVPDAPPPNAVVAIYRFDTAADALDAGYTGPLDADYTGYDLVLFINLSTVTLANPQIGLLSTGGTGSQMTQLQTSSGVASETGWTRVTIAGLGAGQVWATLVPDLGAGELTVNASVDSGNDVDTTIAGLTLDKGRVVFIEATSVDRSWDGPLQRLDATAVTPDGRYLYGLSGDESALIVINADDMSVRQEINEGLSIGDGDTVVDGLDGADHLVVSPDGKFVFAFDEGSDTIAAFKLDGGTGTLSFAGALSFDVAGGVKALEIFATSSTTTGYSYLLLGGDGRSVATGSYDADAGTFQSSGSATRTGTALADVRVSNDGELYYATSASGDSFEVRSLATHEVLAEFDGREHGFDGASAMALSDDDRFVYVLGTQSQSVSVFERRSDDTMVFVETLRQGADGVRGMVRPDDIALSPPQSGSRHQGFLYVAGAGSNSVAVLDRDESTGRLEFVQMVVNNAGGVDGLRAPTELTFAPAGDKLYVSAAGQAGIPGGLVVLAVDTDIGNLKVKSLDVSFANIATLTVTTAGGDDNVVMVGGGPVSTSTLSHVEVDLGEGSDSFAVTSLVGDTVLRMGDGDDRVIITADSPGVALEVHAGGGADEVTLLAAGTGSSMSLHGDGGDDTFRVDSRALAPDMASLMIHGGDPFPTGETDLLVLLNWIGEQGQSGPNPVNDKSFNAVRVQYDSLSSGEVYEGDAARGSAQGMLSVTDPDAGQSRFTAQTVAGIYGLFTIDALGAWRYALDEDDPDTDRLDAGQEAVETFAVTSFDGTASAEVSIRVFGADDPGNTAPGEPQLSARTVLPVTTPDVNKPAAISGDLTGAVTKDKAGSLDAKGSLSVSDSDAGQDRFQAQDATPGIYGHFMLQSDGNWRYVLDDDAVNGLAAGQRVVDVFVVASVDGTENVVVITVNGPDDPLSPVNQVADISGVRTGEVTEDDTALEATGSLSVSDADAGQDKLQAQTATPGAYGHFTLQSDGSWRYVLDDYAADELTAGQKAVDVFTVASADGTESVVVVTVTGANDAAHVFGGHAVRHASVDLAFERGPVVSLNTPLSINEGEDLVIDAQVVPHGVHGELFGEVEWDLDADGVFGDRTGEHITLTWHELNYYGIDDDGSHYAPIVARATNMDADGNAGDTSYTAFELTIGNTPPTVSVHGDTSARAGTPYTIFFSALDPGDDTVHTWRVDWGSGRSPHGSGTGTVEEFGAGTGSAQRIFDEPGTQSIRVTAIDEDGETLGPIHDVRVSVNDADIDVGGPYTIAEGEALVLHTEVPSTPWFHLVGYITEKHQVYEILAWELWTGDDDSITIPWQRLQDGHVGANLPFVSDEGEYRLIYAVQYANGDVARKEFDITITNAPPVASLSISMTHVDEGGQATVTINASDPARDDNEDLTYYFDIDNDGIYERVDPAAGTESIHEFTFSDDGENIVVRALVTDGDGGSTEVFGVITVNEVAPTLNVVPVSGQFAATEGAEFSLALSATDPGDDTISRWVIDWGDGSPRDIHEGAAHTVTHRFRQSGSLTIEVWAYDEDGAYSTSESVTVANVAPTLAGVTVTPATEGAETRLSGAFSDPGVEESFEAEVDWGDGNRQIYRLDGEADDFDFGHVYARDGSYTIVIVLRDADDAEDTATTNVVVANAVPTISLNADRYVLDEGTAVTVFGTVADLGSQDTHVVSIDWGDGTAASTAVVNPSTRFYAATHVYGDDFSSLLTIVATVTDSDGATGTATAGVRVDNVAPVFQDFYVSKVGDVDYDAPRVNVIWTDAEFETRIDANAVETVTVTGAYGDYDADVGTIRVRWGDGNITRAELDEEAETFTATYSYASDASTFVGDIELLVSTPEVRIEDGDEVTLTGRVWDVDADVVSVRIDWGDGAAEEAVVDADTGEFTVEHTFSAQGETDSMGRGVVGKGGSTNQGKGGQQVGRAVRNGQSQEANALAPGLYYIGGVATDDDGGERSTRVAVFVEAPPAFAQQTYAFDLSENRGGSSTAVELGVVVATDPNPGDELTYSISSGSENFAIGGTSGILTYVGSGEDFESAPSFYDLTVQATDQTGRTGSAAVRVTITDANDAAVIGGDTEGAVTEDDVDAARASGTLTVSDPDADQSGFAVQTEVGTYGTFRTGRGRGVDVHAGQHGRGHRRAGCGADGGGGVHGRERGRHHRAGGGDGDGVGRRGGDWRGHRGRGDRGRCGRGAGERDARGERRGHDADRYAAAVHGAGERRGDVRDVHAGRGREVDVHAGQLGRGHQRVGVRGDGDGHLRGGERRRDHGSGGGHGDGHGRRGGATGCRHQQRDQWGRDQWGLDGYGDGGRGGDRGERDADGERPGCGSERVHGAGGRDGDIRDVHAGGGRDVDVHAGQRGREHQCAGGGADGDRALCGVQHRRRPRRSGGHRNGCG